MSDSTLIKKAAGSLIVGGFSDHEVATETQLALRHGELGGVILFRRNVHSLRQVARLNAAIQSCRPAEAPPLLIAVDEEGEKVTRLESLITELPPMRRLGDIDDPDLCRRAGAVLGRELAALGFNTDFAPVFDVDSRPHNPIIGPRSFSSDPWRVRRLAVAFAQGLLSQGVMACAKHFPGHGDTELDSHLDLPVIHHSTDRLESVEWVPFYGAVEADIPLIMTGHLLLPLLDPQRPATLSATLLRGILRSHLGFRGVIISDDLEMAAIGDRYSVAEVMTTGLDAGLDLFLFCHSRERQAVALDTLIHLAERSSTARRRIENASNRVSELRRRLVVSPPGERFETVIRCADHLALLEEIDRRSSACHTFNG